MYKPYYKKIDRSMMDWGFTISREYISDFLAGANLDLGSSRTIQIIWDKKDIL